jgi:hypothetical protein
MFAVALSAVALNAPAPVPVSGGTAAERAIVRQAVSGVDGGVVTSVRIDENRNLVLGPAAFRDPSVGYGRALWEAQALLATVAARIGARGERLRGYRVIGNCGHNTTCGGGGSFAAAGSPSAGPPGARQLRAVVLANARAAGLSVRLARVLPVGGGVLSVVVRLREEQLLDARLQTALATLFGRATTKPVALHFLSIEAPDGTSIAYGGTFVNGGGWNYGGDTGTSPVPRSVPRRLWHAPTDLVVEMTRAVGLVRKQTFHIACAGTAPPPSGSLCRRVLADRWALLVPDAGFTCAGSPAGAWNVSIRGTFAGSGVSRSYNGCYGATVRRWARFLGLPQ